jgi:hypothetical protein
MAYSEVFALWANVKLSLLKTCEANFTAEQLHCRQATSLALPGKLSFGTDAAHVQNTALWGCAEISPAFL